MNCKNTRIVKTYDLTKIASFLCSGISRHIKLFFMDQTNPQQEFGAGDITEILAK